MTIISIILLSVAFIISLSGIFIGMSGLLHIGRLPIDSRQVNPMVYDNPPKVSVVVYASVSEGMLTEYLTQLLLQDLPDFEIIVVYDATYEAAASLSENFSGNDRIRITFIPPGSHNLSRRKLALTLGIKAASGDIIVTTGANCLIPSESWLARMIEPFVIDNKEVAIGYSHPVYSEIRGFGKWYRIFDATMTASAWIGSALRAKPYRGDGYNLAFKRKLFFSNKGYASNINIQSGEDDIFVSEIATPDNTSLVLDSDSILSTVWGSSANRVMSDNKERYDFTSRWLPKTPFFRLGWLSMSIWLSFFCIAAALLAGVEKISPGDSAPVWLLPSIVFPVIIGLLLIIISATTQIIVYRKAALRMKSPRLLFSLPLFFIWHPIGNFIFRLNHKPARYKNFTWQRH